MVIFRLLALLIVWLSYSSCFVKEDGNPSDEPQFAVKSIMLYDTIGGFTLDTITAALDDINRVIVSIDDRQTGYSLWRVQSDTITDYRYLIQAEWPDQAAYDAIHQHPDFRKILDQYVHILTETRQWKLYRRFELIRQVDR